MPAITLIVVWFMPQTFFGMWEFERIGAFGSDMLVFTGWYPVHYFHSTGLLLVSFVLLAYHAVRVDSSKRLAVSWMIVATLVALAAGSFVINIGPGFRLLPIGLGVTSLALGLALFRANLLHFWSLPYDKIIDNLPDPVFLLGHEGHILRTNRAGRDLLMAAGSRSTAEQLPTALASIVATGVASRYDLELERDGISRHYQVNAYQLPEEVLVDRVVMLRDITTEYKATEALRESEERYRLLAENSNDLIGLHELDGAFIYASPSYSRLLGYTLEELYELPVGEIPHPDDFERTQVAHQQVATGNRLERFEYRMLNKDGEAIWVEAASTPIYGEDGEMDKLLVTSRDVTARKEAEAQRNESLTKLEAIYKNTKDGILLADDNMQYIDANPAACEMLGYTRDELVGRSIWEVTGKPIETSEREWSEFKDAEQISMLYELIRKDGTIIITDNRAVTNILPSVHMTVFRNVTERQQMLDELHRQRELLQAIFDTIPVMLTVYDPNGKMSFVNKAIERVLGWTEADAQSVDLIAASYPDPDYRAKVIAIMETAADGWHDLLTTRKDGTSVETSWANVVLSDGTHAGIGIDITERRLAEKNAIAYGIERQRMRVLSSFIDDTSHDLRTPITNIATNTYLLRKESEPDKRNQRLDTIDYYVRYMTTVLEQMQQMALLDSLNDLEKQDTEAGPLIDEALEALHADLEKKSMTVQRHIPSDLPAIHANEDWLFTALENVLHNAVAFSEENDRVIIKAQHGNDALSIVIEDTGPGIPADIQPRVFERLFKGDDARPLTTSGAGLGLPIARRIVELHDGTIDLQSIPGNGTTVTVRLPYAVKNR